MKRRAVLASAFAGATCALAANPVRLPLAESLQGELAAALRAKTPLLVMVSLEGPA